jgi:hypothetical protein
MTLRISLMELDLWFPSNTWVANSHTGSVKLESLRSSLSACLSNQANSCGVSNATAFWGNEMRIVLVGHESVT